MRFTLFLAVSLLLISRPVLAQQTPNTPSAAGSNNDLATQRTDPNTPKPYQPRNPAPDTRRAPTGSSTGTGPDSGGRREMAPKK